MDLPPAPLQPDSEDVPDQPVEEIAETEPQPEPEPPPPDPLKELPPPETPPVPQPEVPLPPPPPAEKKPETKVEAEPTKVEPPKKKRPRKPSVAAAPRPQPAQARAAAPIASASKAPSNAIPNWRSLVAAILERNKRYPSEARGRGDRGTATVQFTINRAGRVVRVALLRGSGSQSLDREAVALVQRAQPFPSPPSELRGGTISLVVPVRFNFR
jgi:protein TonB